jgi:hypothetical protein
MSFVITKVPFARSYTQFTILRIAYCVLRIAY